MNKLILPTLTAVLATVALLTSCGDNTDRVDTVTHPQIVRTHDGGRIIQLIVYRAKSKKSLQKRIGLKSGEARWFVEDNTCSIEFAGNDYITAGHELRHCLDGAFHKEN